MAGDPPPIPGALLIAGELELRRQQVATLLDSKRGSFPGAQPVSFAKHHIDRLKDDDYYVCEKSDGTRCLMYCTTFEDGREATFLINRKNDYYSVPRLHFPLPTDPSCKDFHSNTILDGELVLDKHPDGRKELIFLAFDMLVYEGRDYRQRLLRDRLGCLETKLLRPLDKFSRNNGKYAQRFPFKVVFKKMQFSYAIEMMFRQVIPNLLHGNDGLIFTPMNTVYVSGTDEGLLKWKPAEENSVDFQLRFRFPILPDGTEDASGAPEMELWAMHSEHDYRYYDSMFVDEQDFDRLAAEGARHGGLDGAIVECSRDVQGRWRFMRVRDDKQHANHITVIHKVMDSIRDGVTREELIREAFVIRQRFKERQAAKAAKVKVSDQS